MSSTSQKFQLLQKQYAEMWWICAKNPERVIAIWLKCGVALNVQLRIMSECLIFFSDLEVRGTKLASSFVMNTPWQGHCKWTKISGSKFKRNGVKVPGEYRRKENGVNSPRMDLTLAELQEMASRQQQQIEAQQQLLATKEQRLKFLKQQDQRQQQQVAEQEKLKRLKEIAENQEAKLKK